MISIGTSFCHDTAAPDTMYHIYTIWIMNVNKDLKIGSMKGLGRLCVRENSTVVNMKRIGLAKGHGCI
jgi:hypothetical protein